MTTPRLSILIPNFNNGRAASAGGARDFIDDLLSSLVRTLADDPTPLEIIVADDGSTDDSLATCRRWARRTWRGGEPVCRLLEGSHCGVLSVVSNRLFRSARGELCCRLDGDVVLLTAHWASRLCRVFDEAAPGLGVVGAKQLAPDGRVHAAGDWVLHPRGYHHVAKGAPRHAVVRPLEVDHVMGCFYACRRSVWEAVEGFDESILRGQTVDFSLRARLAGWRVISTPDIEFVHHHPQRNPRGTRADSEPGVADALQRFRDKWGFDRLAPDLDVVARRYAGTPLLWNAEVFGPRPAWPPPAESPLDVSESEWSRFTDDQACRAAARWRLSLVEQLAGHLGPRRRVGYLYSRAGLLGHLMAKQAVPCVGIDPDPSFVTLARSVVARQTYPGPRPSFVAQRHRTRLPLPDGSLDTLLLVDAVERHPNPVGLYREANRVLGDGGVAVVTARRRDGWPDADPHAWRHEELELQLRVSGWLDPIPLDLGAGNTGLVVVVARRRRRVNGSSPRTRGCCQAGSATIPGHSP